MNRREMAGLGLAVALVGLLAAWEPENHIAESSKMVPVRVTTSSRGSRPEVLGARSLPAKPTPTVAASPTSGPVSLGVFRISAYSNFDDPGMNGLGITRSGQPTRWGVVAVDPAVFPLGSRLLIEGFGSQVFDALDTGGLVIGRCIDVWMASRQEALRFGVQERGVRLAR